MNQDTLVVRGKGMYQWERQ